MKFAFLSRDDIRFVAALAALAVVYLYFLFDFGRVPFEDAAMLMRYTEHLASGHGIVWNIGQAPVDGATDFLFMVALAGLVKLGLSPESAARGMGFAAHMLTVLLVYAGIVRYAGGRRWMAFFTSAFLLFGPGLRYVEAYFGTPVFAFLASLSWFLALSLITGKAGRGTSWWFAVIALATGLTRPEGVPLCVLMLAAVMYANGWRRALRTVWIFVGVFAVAGALYLEWRKIYFGYLLPNPFYAKGGGTLYLANLTTAARHSLTFLFPFVPVFACAIAASFVSLDRRGLIRLLGSVGTVLLVLAGLGLARTSDPTQHATLVWGRYSPRYLLILLKLLVSGMALWGATAVAHWLPARVIPGERMRHTALGDYLAHARRWTIIVLIPVVGYTTIWILIQEVMNYLFRFQYALMPMVCMVWPTFLTGAGRAFYTLAPLERRWRPALIVLGAAAVIGAASLQRSMMIVQGRFHDGRFEMGVLLSKYAGRGYTMATTEAGLLPYYSKWNAVDLYGFNDRWIAHHNLSADYLDRYKPEIIMMSTRFPLVVPPGVPTASYAPLCVAKRYAEENGYVLAAAYGGGPDKVHYYYVRRGFADSDEIVREIRHLDYTWYLSGHRAVDFASRDRVRDLHRVGQGQ